MPTDPNSGRFISTQSIMDRYLAKIDTSGGPEACHPWTGGRFSNGYGRLSLDDDRRRSVRSHRWGFEQIIGPIPDGMVVRHTCDNPLCHNPTHWVLGSNADNSADMVDRGRSLRGEANPASRLTADDVLIIKRDLLPLTARGRGRGRGGEVTLKSIARRYGVTPPVIANIRDGKTWSEVRVGELDQ